MRQRALELDPSHVADLHQYMRVLFDHLLLDRAGARQHRRRMRADPECLPRVEDYAETLAGECENPGATCLIYRQVLDYRTGAGDEPHVDLRGDRIKPGLAGFHAEDGFHFHSLRVLASALDVEHTRYASDVDDLLVCSAEETAEGVLADELIELRAGLEEFDNDVTHDDSDSGNDSESSDDGDGERESSSDGGAGGRARRWCEQDDCADSDGADSECASSGHRSSGSSGGESAGDSGSSSETESSDGSSGRSRSSDGGDSGCESSDGGSCHCSESELKAAGGGWGSDAADDAKVGDDQSGDDGSHDDDEVNKCREWLSACTCCG
jgi:hypothetical protein